MVLGLHALKKHPVRNSKKMVCKGIASNSVQFTYSQYIQFNLVLQSKAMAPKYSKAKNVIDDKNTKKE